jgi:hypothetical protein
MDLEEDYLWDICIVWKILYDNSGHVLREPTRGVRRLRCTCRRSRELTSSV